MAIPPEPIEEVIGGVHGAVLAEVVKVLTQDPQQVTAKVPPGTTDGPGVAARQVVELKVSSVLFGDVAAAGASVQVVKPAGDYALRAGNKGPFLLTRDGKALSIVGRYGPDTYSEEKIRTAAKRVGKA